MRKKNIIFASIIAITIIIFFAATFFQKRQFNTLKVFQDREDLGAAIVYHYQADEFFDQEAIWLAVCPTFYYMIEKIPADKKIIVKKTGSTGDSLKLLEQGKVDLIVSGRPLKKEETGFLSKKIGPGYDFIFSQEIVILEREMNLFTFYTDLFPETIIEDFPYLFQKNVIKTDNPFDYLDQGIVVSLLDDRIEGEIIHIINEDGLRVRLSRLPRIYYLPDFSEEKLNIVKEIIKEN